MKDKILRDEPWCKEASHRPSHTDVNDGFVVCVQFFVVLALQAVEVKPVKIAFGDLKFG